MAIVGAVGLAVAACLAIGPARSALVAVACASAAAVLVARHRDTEPADRVPWLLLAAGIAVLGSSQLVDLLTDGSAGDWEIPLRAAAIVCMISGLWTVVHDPGTRRRLSLIDPTTIAIGAAVVSWLFILDPIARRDDLGTVDVLIFLAIPVLDLVLLGAAVRLFFSADVTVPSLRLLLGGAGALLVGETVEAVTTVDGAGGGTAAASLLWMAAAALVAVAGVHPSVKEVSAPRDHRYDMIQPIRLVMLGLAAIAGPIAVIIKWNTGAALNVPVVVGGVVLLFMLILLRMGDLVQVVGAAATSHLQAVGREKTLRRAAHALVAATDRTAIYGVAADAAAALARDRPTVEVRLFIGPEERMQVVAVRGVRSEGSATLALAGLPARVVEQMRAGESVTVCLGDAGLEDEVAAALGATPEHPHCLVSPVLVNGAIAGVMSVALEREAGGSRRRAIDTVCSQAALAIETVTLMEEVAARAGEQRFRSLVQNASDVILVVEPGGIIRFVTRSVTRMLGYEPHELQGASLARILHKEDAKAGPSVLVDGHVLDWRLRTTAGGFRHIEVIVADLRDDPNVEGIVLTMRDVTDRRELELRLAHQAFHDTLTGLPNRALFEDRVRHALARTVRRPTSAVAVIFIDLDDFKGVNDTLGHQAGDELLCSVARRLELCLRGSDTAARLGGDEFAVALELDEFDPEETVVAVANRILEAMRKPFLLSGQEVYTRGSLGIAVTPEAGETVDELLRNADVAMYVAKKTGKGRYRRYEDGMHAPVLRKMELRTELQRAIDREEFRLLYQPVVELPTGRIVGFEALVRWQHPEHGLISPAEFIPLAEDAGVIGAMGKWILNESCRQFATWGAAYPAAASMFVGVNLSAQQLRHGNLVGEIDEILSETGLDPTCLVLELTESVFVEDKERTITRMSQLKARGVRIAIDDFGTGFSALAYLQRLPVDVLKLASPFVQGLMDGQGPLTETILRLARTLQLEVIAEGIEEQSTADELIALGCQVGQGFLFGKPLPAGEVETRLAEVALSTPIPPVLSEA
jgi:diguanylate cyclase (GGDEF)-like protein/PAS domain S-box-containing protein